MNIVLIITLLFFVFWKGDWRNWEKYYPSMLYIALAATIYETISYEEFHLWEFKKDIFFSKFNVHLLHNLVVNPLVVLLYLSNYPIHKRRFLYNVKWITGFWFVEIIASEAQMITYYNGWNLAWSLLFIIVMFPMVHLHHRNKTIALPLSIGISILLLVIFHYV
ncbi:CBO0543 family protein [Anaerobacillus sp. 1_MG-2023]|uniref:CBO0543 family protein n=1 Tax=Anaerobacillus sp. 1_MG-2023 TaxID=3062655 RepID=UPI0026E23CB5|nr:CBO0543 family protein [Anaerobacillus sp. 1_MG-2023]MDO6654273.1 CBO0543 family protein [Anaerobacillus sp. 1_MG-2023]